MATLTIHHVSALVLEAGEPYLLAMRVFHPFLLAVGGCLVLAGSALAQAQHRPAAPAPAGPKALGKFEDWTAATHTEGGQLVCYAFTRAASSAPAVPNRSEVVLTVTQRPTGRDAVAISAGFAYPQNAEVAVQVDQTALNFYTSQRSAFAREGAQAVATFQRGRQAVARSPGPRNVPVVDTFSLRGFAQAYAATVKACPPAR
jgi:hypothetical protein